MPSVPPIARWRHQIRRSHTPTSHPCRRRRAQQRSVASCTGGCRDPPSGVTACRSPRLLRTSARPPPRRTGQPRRYRYTACARPSPSAASASGPPPRRRSRRLGSTTMHCPDAATAFSPHPESFPATMRLGRLGLRRLTCPPGLPRPATSGTADPQSSGSRTERPISRSAGPHPARPRMGRVTAMRASLPAGADYVA